MNFKSHIKGAIAFGIATIPLLDYSFLDTSIYLGSVMIGGLLPDLDHTKSYLGSRLLLISKPLSKLVGHRTFTHSLVTLSTLLILNDLFWDNSIILTGLIVGMLSHILLDCLTPGGVALLYPFIKYRYSLRLRLSRKIRRLKRIFS